VVGPNGTVADFCGGLHRAGVSAAHDLGRPTLHLGKHPATSPYFGIDAVQRWLLGCRI